MPIGSCLGTERKKKICAEYKVTPVVHLRALAGQPKLSCAGREVETWFYMFRAEHRVTLKVENFFAGDHAAKEFLQLIPAPPLPAFNPLTGDIPDDGDDNEGPEGRLAPSTPGEPRNERARTPLNRELFRAVRLFVYWLPGDPGKALSGLISDIDQRPDDRRNASCTRALNTMVGRYQRTLRQMIDDLAARGNQMRQFEFPLINATLTGDNNIDP